MSSRIANEIAHGRRIAPNAEQIWNWAGPAGRVRWERRVAFVAARLPRGGRVLEVGCGTGLLTEALAAAGARLTAIDVSGDLLRRAAARVAGVGGVQLARQNAYCTGFRGASFDAIVGISVLHHLDLPLALAEFRRLLRPGGKLLFSEPNMANPIVLATKNVTWLKRRAGDSPDETAFFRGGLARSLRRAGFDARVEPFDFLHPGTPASLVRPTEALSRLLERLPVVRELGGSLLVEAVLPAGASRASGGA